MSRRVRVKRRCIVQIRAVGEQGSGGLAAGVRQSAQIEQQGFDWLSVFI